MKCQGNDGFLEVQNQRPQRHSVQCPSPPESQISPHNHDTCLTHSQWNHCFWDQCSFLTVKVFVTTQIQNMTGSKVRPWTLEQTQIWILALPLISCVNLGKWCNLSTPPFLYLVKVDANNSTYCSVCCKNQELTYIKCLRRSWKIESAT